MKAFPEVKYIKSGEFGSHIMVIEGGMDLRDYFAAQALNGVASITGVDWGGKAEVARVCYDLADAMMEARK